MKIRLVKSLGSPIKPKKKDRSISLEDLDDDLVYGVWCYGRRTFGCAYLPATGLEHKNNWQQLFEFGAVFMHSGPRSKDDFLIELPNGKTVVAQLYKGDYQPLRRYWLLRPRKAAL